VNLPEDDLEFLYIMVVIHLKPGFFFTFSLDTCGLKFWG